MITILYREWLDLPRCLNASDNVFRDLASGVVPVKPPSFFPFINIMLVS
jgi:hypothetical protein